MRKKTTENFIHEALAVHGDKYDYSKTVYTGNKNKVIIYCKHCKRYFEQRAFVHISGSGCPICNLNSKTTEQFIEKAKTIHGNAFDYSKTVYKGSQHKITVTCNSCGKDIIYRPDNFLNLKQGCPFCNKMTTEEFVEKLQNIYGDKYDYSKVEYVNKKTKVEVGCDLHGYRKMLPYALLNGKGCPCCSKIKRSTEDFINEARAVHSDKYDYSQVKYVSSKTKVKIGCPLHGYYETTPDVHLKSICPQCALDNRKISQDEFLKKAIAVHGDKYDYSGMKYINMNEKIDIFCKTCGIIFSQQPCLHIRSKGGCPICSRNRKTQEQFIKDAIAIYSDRYDYNEVVYVNCHTKVKIYCKEHNSYFWITPNDFLSKHTSCPLCNPRSYLEIAIYKLLDKYNINYIREKKFEWLIFKHKMRLDFYLPEYNIAIECQGGQHFKSVKIYGGDEELLSNQLRDKTKYDLCKEHNIEVIYYIHQKHEKYLENTEYTYFTDEIKLLDYILSKKDVKIPGSDMTMLPLF